MAGSRRSSGASQKQATKSSAKTSATPLKLPPIQQSQQEPSVSRRTSAANSTLAKSVPVTGDERHRCPHHPTGQQNKGDTACLLSEYANRYHPHPLDRRQPIKPEYKPNANQGPLEDATTNRVDYIKHPYEKPYAHQGDEYKQPEGNFDHMTNYTKDYPKKAGERARPLKKDSGPRVSGKFEGEPTYKNDYRKWSAAREKPIIKDQGYRPTSQPFEGMPTYTKDYIKHQSQPRGMIRPAETNRASDQPMDDRTGYRDEYIKHPMEPRFQKEKAVYAPNAAKLDDLTTNRKDYTPKDGGRSTSFKPAGNAYQSNAPFDEDTTQRVDYKKWPTEKPFVHEHDQYRKPEGEMNMNTTHTTDFTKKPLSMNPPVRPSSQRRVPGKFDDSTNYNNDFRKWSAERARPKQRSGYEPNEAPFEGMPTYTKDYIKHQSQPRGMIRPAETNRASDQPMDDRTGYRDEYIKHPMEPRFQKEKAVYAPNAAKLDDLTTNRKDYTPKDGGRSTSFKPAGNAYQSNAPFDEDTTQRVDYKKWPTEKPFVHEHDQYRKPEGEMNMNTTHTTDFTKKPLSMNPPVRPSSQRRVPGKFDDSTNYNNDFRKWSAERARPKQRSGYEPNEAPFEGTPTYTKDYIKHRQAPPQSLKPADTGHRSDAPFEDGTEYRQEFLPKRVPPCPAIAVDTGVSFTFREQDDRGHKWYEPGTSITDLRATNGQQPMQTALSVA